MNYDELRWQRCCVGSLVRVFLITLALVMGWTLPPFLFSAWARDEDHPFLNNEGDLEKGEAVVTHQDDQFEGQILIPAPLEALWSVLTDYEQFPTFMPGVVENRIERQSDPQTLLMETKSVTSVLLVRVNSTVQLSLREDPLSAIEFNLVRSDSLKTLSGSWQLDTVETPQKGILLTYRAQAVTDSVPSGLFAGVFSRQIRLNLTAIRDEVFRRDYPTRELTPQNP